MAEPAVQLHQKRPKPHALVAAAGMSLKDAEMDTLVDKMLTFVQERGKTTVAEVSEVFAVDTAQVEKLAAVLEESGLITMRYALLHPGRTELVSLHPATMGQPAKHGVPGTPETAAPMHDFELREMINAADSDVQEMQQQLNALESDIMNRLVKVDTALTLIDAKEKGATADDLDYVYKEAAKLELTRKDMSLRLKIFEKRLDTLGNRLRSVKRGGKTGPLHGIVGAITGIFKRGKKTENVQEGAKKGRQK
jgi:hypothetical protein